MSKRLQLNLLGKTIFLMNFLVFSGSVFSGNCLNDKSGKSFCCNPEKEVCVQPENKLLYGVKAGDYCFGGKLLQYPSPLDCGGAFSWRADFRSEYEALEWRKKYEWARLKQSFGDKDICGEMLVTPKTDWKSDLPDKTETQARYFFFDVYLRGAPPQGGNFSCKTPFVLRAENSVIRYEKTICPDGLVLANSVLDNSPVCKKLPAPDIPNMCMAQDGIIVGNPIIPATAEKIQLESDFQGVGVDALSFVRNWLSGRTRIGFRPPISNVMGVGWLHNHMAKVSFVANEAQVHLPDGNSRTFSKSAQGQWQAAGHPQLKLNLAPDGTAVLTDSRANTRLDFDAAGRMVAQTARNGWQTTYSYNPAGQLTTIRNAFGRSLTLSYTKEDASGLIAAVTTPDGVIRYEYDTAPAAAAGNTAPPANAAQSATPSATSLQRLKAVIYPDGSRKIYLYEHPVYPELITGITDQNGFRYATFGYDVKGRAHSTKHGINANKFEVHYQADDGGPGTLQKSRVQVKDPLL